MLSHPEKPEPSKSKKLTDSPMPPLPFAHLIKNEEESDGEDNSSPITNSVDIQRIINKEGQLTIEEADILLKDFREKGKIIKKKLNEIYRKRGVTAEYIEKYINDPSNFSPEIWNAINKKRSEIASSIHLPENLINIEPSPTDASAAKTRDRRKIGGAHRRGWLPMR